MKNFKMITICLLLSLTFVACKKDETPVTNPIPNGDLAAQIVGTYIGDGAVAGLFVENYELQLTRIDNQTVSMSGEHLPAKTMPLEKDELTGAIFSGTTQTQMMSYFPNSKDLVVVRPASDNTGLSFIGKKQ